MNPAICDLFKTTQRTVRFHKAICAGVPCILTGSLQGRENEEKNSFNCCLIKGRSVHIIESRESYYASKCDYYWGDEYWKEQTSELVKATGKLLCTHHYLIHVMCWRLIEILISDVIMFVPFNVGKWVRIHKNFTILIFEANKKLLKSK